MGKKTIRALLVMFLIVLALSAPAWAETAVVTGDEVNLREGPGTGFRIIDCLTRGEYVTVTDRSNADWYYVEHNGDRGFMSSAFLDVREEQAEETAALTAAIRGRLGNGQDGYVNAMYVRLRSAPGSDYSVLGEYNRGKALSYYGTFGEWAACIIDDKAGFLYADYITLGSFDGWDSEAQYPPGEATPAPAWSWQDPSIEAAQAPTPSEQLALEHAAQAESGQYEGIINANYVRFRTGPASSYPIIDTYSAGTVISVTGTYREWTAGLIDGQFGFVYSDFVSVREPEPEVSVWEQTVPVPMPETPLSVPMPETIVAATTGYTSGNSIRMRSAPSMAAPIVAELSYGSALTIVGYTGEWTAAIYGSTCGYIYSQYVSQGSFQIAQIETPGDYLSGSNYEKGVQIAQYAMQFVGCNYCWGGRDPSTGFDCSGLVYYVYQHFGITLNRVAQDQALNGVPVSWDQLQPGDVLCFYSGSSYIGHSGIYIGNGMFVHAQNSATGVVITELYGHYAERGFEARRIV